MGKSKKRFEIIRKMGARVHYAKKKSWNTRSNKIRQLRTPGGRLAAHYVAKKSKGPGNGLRTSSVRLGGLRRMRPTDYRREAKHTRRISRAYGGVYTHSEVKNRIIRTFLTEEVKNVKKLWLYKLLLNQRKKMLPRKREEIKKELSKRRTKNYK